MYKLCRCGTITYNKIGKCDYCIWKEEKSGKLKTRFQINTED